MAATTGKKRHKDTGSLGFLCVLIITIVPYYVSAASFRRDIKLTVADDSTPGTVILHSDIIVEECVEMFHVQKTQSTTFYKPLILQKDGSIITNSSLREFVGDLFVFHPKSNERCGTFLPVSLNVQMQVEVVPSQNKLTFLQSHYTGSVPKTFTRDTKVNGITNLYACHETCRNNIEYNIVGTKDFYLQTISTDQHVQLAIFVKDAKAVTKQADYNFIITAENENGLLGHTTVHINVASSKDNNLYYIPKLNSNPVPKSVTSLSIVKDVDLDFPVPHSRHRRQLPVEELPLQTIAEDRNGVLFNVANDTTRPGYTYQLVSSSYEGAFTVTSNGNVVTPGLDFEALTNKTVLLVINALHDNTVMRELIQRITITNVNDELPEFTNKPSPFLAVVNPIAVEGVLIYRLTAVDRDEGSSLFVNFTYGANAATYFQANKIGNSVVEIKRRGSTTIPNGDYTITVNAYDNAATPVQSTTDTVQIRAGKRDPQFYETQYVVRFQEENTVGQRITSTPILIKSFQKQPIIWTILDDQNIISTIFTAQQATVTDDDGLGITRGCNLIVNRRVDYETDPQTYSLTLRATDSEDRTATVQVEIQVTDYNEAAPVFTQSTYKNETVREDITPGTELLRVTATDADANSQLSFSVDNDHFSVEAVNLSSTQGPYVARILVNKHLDYDSISPKLYDFNVIATDNGALPKQGQAVIRIFMVNLNDEEPVFQNMSADIFYDADVETDVFVVQATDADIGDVVSYELQDSFGKFTIDGVSGRITLSAKIANSQDQISSFLYELVVIGTDNGACCGSVTQLTGTGTLTVNILTENEFRPVFQQCRNLNPKVDEEQVNAYVTQVSASDQDVGKNGEVTYSIREQNSQFRINSSTGQIYTNVAIDREALQGSTKIPVNVLATDGGDLQSTCSLLVEILDINDKKPVFSEDSYTFRVTYDSSVGHSVGTVVATDADIAQNAAIRYSLVTNEGGYFTFDNTSMFTGTLKVAKQLPDVNTITTTTLVVMAEDEGSPSLNSTVTVTIQFIENQDFAPPQWLGAESNFYITVPEDVVPLSILLNFSAETKRATPGLSFGLVDGIERLFATKSGTTDGKVLHGYLINNALLDYESAPVSGNDRIYTLTLRATDGSGTKSDHPCYVNVTDVNDIAPSFEFALSDDNYLEFEVNEDDYSSTTGLGQYIGRVEAVDRDGTSPNNKIRRYYLSSQNPDFTLTDDGNLYTKGVYDRETMVPDPYVVISVAAEDDAPSSHNPAGPNVGTANVRIRIKDVNDNAPYFERNFTFNAREDEPVNKVIGQVTAKDEDSSAILQYTLTPLTPQTAPFTINQPVTGNIIVTSSLDYELGVNTYVMSVSVWDQKFSSTATVTINILDVNDNPPEVADEEFNDFTEERDDDVGQIIKRINATDVDNDGVNTFNFSLRFTDNLSPQYFAIDQNTGDLRLIKKLDRDFPNGLAEFKFTVIVADSIAQPLFGYASVTVRPKDINDNAPVFLESGRLMSVQEEVDPIGGNTRVGRLQVEDYDAGNNSTFTLFIFQQNPQPQNMSFTLGGGDAMELFATAKLDRETIPEYTLVIIATDNGDEPMTGTGTVTVSVRDINDNPPFFNVSLYEFQLHEKQNTGEVGRIQGYDLDINENAELTYTLDGNSGANAYFRMDTNRTTNEGILRVVQTVDFDAGLRNFTMTAYARDPDPGVNNSKRASTTIIVYITDDNDEKPIFEKLDPVSVYENIDVGTSLVTVTASDRDVNNDYNTFEYYISRASDPTRRFSVNPLTGLVQIQNPLDRETVARHEVEIIAIDNLNGEDQQTGTATLTVHVLDINDNYPDFATTYNHSLLENEVFNNDKLFDFSAIDRDNATNGPPFSFEMNCSTTGSTPQICNTPYGQSFSLTTDTGGDGGRGTGTIFMTGTFDREQASTVTIDVRMCDLRGLGRQDQQCGTRQLHISIGDKNDNKHSAGYQYITVYNYKGMFGDFEIGTVNDNDPDEINDDKTFTLLNDAIAGRFVSVHQETGKITLLDRVPEVSFEVQVEVRDTTGFAATSTVRIEVMFVTEDAVFNSGSVRMNGITPQDFLTKPKIAGDASSYGDSMSDKFRNLLAVKLHGSSTPANIEKVQIVSIMASGSGGTDVRFSAHGSPWYSNGKMNGVVTSNLDEFNGVLQTNGVSNTGTVDMVPIDMCKFETCEGGCFNELVVNENNPVLIDTAGSSYVGVGTQVVGTCGCRATDFSDPVSCSPGYCLHGGECNQDDYGVVSCTCPSGYEGPRCQILRQSFDGTGYALYKQLEQCEESRTSIEILTEQQNGLIMYNGPTANLDPADPRDFILLELVNGYPRLRIDHGTGELTLTVQGITLHDNTWHRIDIHRNRKHVRLVVDNCKRATYNGSVEDRSNCEASGYTRGENIYVNAVQVLQLGGRYSSPPFPTGVITQKFRGCMKNLVHNAEIYDLATEGQFPGAEDGCPAEDNACGSAGCGNGQCMIISASNPTCVCNPGYRKATANAIQCTTATTVQDLKTNSYMQWRLKNTFIALLDDRESRVSFHYRTSDPDGHLFTVKGENSRFIIFQMENNILSVVYKIDSMYEVRLNNVDAADGQWHKVTLERYGKELILKLDGGEGRFYSDISGPPDEPLDFKPTASETFAGAELSVNNDNVNLLGQDMTDTCYNDVRFHHYFFPMAVDEVDISNTADYFKIESNELNCERGDLFCDPHYEKVGGQCLPIDYCARSPCFTTGTCANNVPPKANENPFICTCIGEWYGPLCQCHQELKSGGAECALPPDPPGPVGMAGGVIAAIVLGILFLIIAIVLLIYFVMRRNTTDKAPLEDDFDDDTMENVMYYDEEGAGEEDQTTYDLNRLRKPDDGEHPSTWDLVDPKKSVQPLGSSKDRPEIGDFIHNRLNDADDDYGGPPYDTPHMFDFEGGGSDAGSLSSLNTSSSGDQDYDYLNEWGPKFAKLAELYNNYDVE